MAVYAQVPNWREFQHYKDRSPPWIKLHRKLLDDFEFQSLPTASRALAPCIWLLASEETEGVVRVDVPFLSFRVRITHREASEAIKSLIEHGFIEPVEGTASDLIAECLRDAIPETEAETEAECLSGGEYGYGG